MPTNLRCSEIVNDGFEELALALGGVAASHEISDEAVWDLARAFDVTHSRVQARLSKIEFVPEPGELPEAGSGHPAVTHLLQRLNQNKPWIGGDGGEHD